MKAPFIEKSFVKEKLILNIASILAFVLIIGINAKLSTIIRFMLREPDCFVALPNHLSLIRVKSVFYSLGIYMLYPTLYIQYL